MGDRLTLAAIVFDFDGVIVESIDVKSEAFVALYADQPDDIRAQVLDYHLAHGGVSRYDKIRYYESVLLGRPANDDDVQRLAARFSEIVEAKVVAAPYVKGAAEFLERHHLRIPFYVASGTPEDELRRIVDKRLMSHFFRGVYGTPVKKDEHIENVLKGLNINRDQVLMVGDAMSDYEAAEKTGVHFIARHNPHAPVAWSAGTVVVDDLSALNDLVTFL